MREDSYIEIGQQFARSFIYILSFEFQKVDLVGEILHVGSESVGKLIYSVVVRWTVILIGMHE